MFAKLPGVCYPGGVPGAALIGAFALCLAACGNRSQTQPPPPKPEDAGVVIDAAVVEVPARPLGLPDLAAYHWRKRGGHPAFRRARAAESKGQWSEVVTLCKQALAADPSNLEASWLLAAALGRLDKHGELVAPLQRAAAGDFGKWGFASLELPAFRSFLASPLGAAWRRRVETDRVAYVAALARSQIVVSEGDLYGYDPETTRWYRLTRTFGTMLGAIRVSSTKLAYVSRRRSRHKKTPTLAIGVVDLATGKTSHPIRLGTRGPLRVAYSGHAHAGIWISTDARTWRRLDESTYKWIPLPPKTPRPPGPWLEVIDTPKQRSIRLHAIPVPGVTADWDDKGLASAIRIAKSGRVVTVPSPGLIDGNTLTWSPDHARIAFVAQLDEQRHCDTKTDKRDADAVNAAAFVADATTGTVTEIDRAASIAIEWMGDRKLLIDEGGVSIFDLDGNPPKRLDGADGLVRPRRAPTCTPATPAPSDDLPPADDEPDEEDEPDGTPVPPSVEP